MPGARKKRLVLFDAHAVIHRAYHALPDFSSSKGEPTGALYGLSTMLMKIITELKPDYMAACYDLPGKTFRHEAYEAYKAGRKKADDELVAQLKNSRQIFQAFGIPIYDAPGFEADDVLGTITEKIKNSKNKKDIDVIIASGDMDTMQLVDDERVRVYTLRKGITDTVLYDERAIIERFGFKPAQIPDFKGLRGDASDNIPGIKGIGEKTASGLIKEFGTIEEIYKQLNTKNSEEKFEKLGLSERIIKLLKDNKEEAVFSKTLAKIRTDAPVDFKLPEKTFWETADFGKVENVFSELEFRSLVSRLKDFFKKNGHEVKEETAAQGGLFDAAEVKPRESRGSTSATDDRELRETSIALWLLDSDLSNPSLQDILFFAKTKSFQEARDKIFRELKEKKLEKVFEEIEKPIISAVAKMEEAGVLIDKKYFRELSAEYHTELEKITGKIYKLAGAPFNINSPKQLSEVLFKKLGLKSGRKNASGNLSTRFSVLEELAEENPIAKEILSHRELSKLLSTYIDVIPKMVGPDGRLHAKFLQAGAATGRFSSQEPNLQNLPIKSELGRRIRRGFVAEKGYKLLAFDYSQIELRAAAMLSKDKKLTQIFKEGKDAHAGVAAFVFGVPIEKVDAEMRRKAKVINFGIIYGMGVSSLRKSLGGTREEAQKFYDNYFRQFSGLSEYLKSVEVFAARNRYTETLFGRRRYFPNINSKIPYIKAQVLRTAVNAPIQGTATADIIKLAIRFANEDLEKAGLLSETRLILQVHDELVYEVREEILPEAEKIIKNAMEGVLGRSYLHLKNEVPLVVHSGRGDNLGEVK